MEEETKSGGGAGRSQGEGGGAEVPQSTSKSTVLLGNDQTQDAALLDDFEVLHLEATLGITLGRLFADQGKDGLDPGGAVALSRVIRSTNRSPISGVCRSVLGSHMGSFLGCSGAVY